MARLANPVIESCPESRIAKAGEMATERGDAEPSRENPVMKREGAQRCRGVQGVAAKTPQQPAQE
jgi:hypothetical protein